MSQPFLIAVGASAGGVQPLETLVSTLPVDLNAAVFVVLHTPPGARSRLPEILQRRTKLNVVRAVDGDAIRAGRIYVAEPDSHLVIEPERIRNTRGPRENRSRPSIDVLFRSAAYSHAERVVGVILSGTQDDGTAGLWAIKDCGGVTMVQDPEDAEYGSMARSAMTYVEVDHVAPVSELGSLLVKATAKAPSKKSKQTSKELELEARVAREGRALQLGVMELGPATPYTCPECHGVLVQLKEGGVPRFRCQTGHAYSINSLLSEVTQHVEHNLWTGVRAIEESMMLLRQLAAHVRADVKKDPGLSASIDERAKAAGARADLVRQALMTHQSLSEDNVLDLAWSPAIGKPRDRG